VSATRSTSGAVTGLALRDALAADYAANFRRLGWPVDMEFLTRLAAQDLNLVEAHERDASPSSTSASAPTPVAPMRTSAAEALADRGVEMIEGERKQWKSRVIDAPPALMGERFRACANRIAQILHSGADQRATFKRGGLHAMLAETEVPKLAREVTELFLHYTALRNRPSKWNPFRDLGPKDAARALIRGLEDIADRSTAVLGPWWVR